MVLHLLSKKSWNVYNHAAIEKVRADEAAEEARQEAEDQRLRDYEAERRLALLRGETAPAPPVDLPEVRREKRPRDEGGAERSRKRPRKLPGEDDTDRDIRLALEERTAKTARQEKGGDDTKKSSMHTAPLVDHAGHVQLFAPPDTSRIRAAKNQEAEDEKKQKRQELSDQYTMRFDNAAGIGKGADTKPWYARGAERVEEEGGKNAFGRDDPRRGGRDAARLVGADPMAAIKKAQGLLREAKRAREEEERSRRWVMQDVEQRDSREDGHGRLRHRKHRSRSRERRRSKSGERERTRDRHGGEETDKKRHEGASIGEARYGRRH